MRKYLVWKFPFPVAFDGAIPHTVDPVEEEAWELIDIINCFTIPEMAEQAEDAVRRNMEETYGCQVEVSCLSELDSLSYLTSEKYNYEVKATAYTSPEPTIIFYAVKRDK